MRRKDDVANALTDPAGREEDTAKHQLKYWWAEKMRDGMTRDSAGNIYLTGKGVIVFDKDGKKLGDIAINNPWTANVCFGGTDMKTLFITASDAVFTVQLSVAGER